MAEGTLPQFRIARPTDVPAILRLLQAAFADWPRIPIDVSPLEHLEWKMQAPDGLEVAHTVGTIDDEIVAVDLRWMTLTQVDGRMLLTNDGAEKAVHPAYQGRGFNRAINESEPRRAQRGEFGLAPPNTNERLVRSARSGTPLGELRESVRTVGLRSTLGSHRAGGLPQLLRVLPRLVRATPRRHSGADSFTIEPIEAFDQRFDGLWETVRSEFRVIRSRRPSYLNWRFGDPRSGRTLIRVASLRGELVGYVVFRPDGRSATLLDLLVDPAHPAAAAALLDEGAVELERQGCRAISAALPEGHWARAALATAGFVDTGQRLPVRFAPAPGGATDEDPLALHLRSGQWHVTVGEFEYA